MHTLLNWPKSQNFLTETEQAERVDRCRESFLNACRNMRIETDLTPYLTALYLPLAAWLQRSRNQAGHPLVIGLTGGQGSGKSTVCELLKTVLQHGFDASVAALSIDDIYKTRAAREQLAEQVHPLFITRGVPGTHDVGLGIETIARLCKQTADDATPIPSFDKAVDDRRPREQWLVFDGPADFVIFEGWCVGAKAQSEQALKEPINVLERDEDHEATWRSTVNKELTGNYKKLFDLIDVQLMLKVESMEQVFEWRRLQEHKLRARIAEAMDTSKPLRVMSDAEVDRFIMHYERLTRHLLDEMPQRADIVFFLDDTHNAAKMKVNRPI